MRLETSKGDFLLRDVSAWAPRGADRFHALVRAGSCDDVHFYRVLPKFYAQFGLYGDPEVTRKWMKSKIPDDPVVKKSLRGTPVFAKSEPNLRTTVVFFNMRDSAALDGAGFAPFVEVAEGMEVVDALPAGYVAWGDLEGGRPKAWRRTFKLGAKPGDTWASPRGKGSGLFVGLEEVVVPAGRFTDVLHTRVVDDDGKTHDFYFAPTAGLVKWETAGPRGSSLLQLRELLKK